MVLFNLIEQDWREKEDNYLDITTPASRGLLLLESSGRYSVQISSLSMVQGGGSLMLRSVNEFVFGKGEPFQSNVPVYIE